MEKNITLLLTEINNAGTSDRPLNLTGIDIQSEAAQRLNFFWSRMHMVCRLKRYAKDCLSDMQGYQARDISVTFKPKVENYDEDVNRSLVISLSRQGQITGVRPALQSNPDVETFMNNSNGVVDKRRREEIKKWVEDFRCYYNERNIQALRQIFSEDALIITGSVVTPKKTEARMTEEAKIRYNVQDKETYLTNLETKCFNPNYNKYINVTFDHISVEVDGGNPNIYGVRLWQKWVSSIYSDEGWLFILWDFQDEDHPQIHVRTWQPDQVSGKRLQEGDVFQLGDFVVN